MTEVVRGGAARPVTAAGTQVDLGPLVRELGVQLAAIGEIFLQAMTAQLLAQMTPGAPRGDGFEGISRQGIRVQPLDVDALKQPKDVPFFSQFDAGNVPGAGEGAAYRACRAMAHAVGVKMAAGPGDRLDVASAGLQAVRAQVDAELAQGHPVALAVAREGGTTDYILAVDQPEPNAWLAFDPGHRDPAAGRSQLVLFDEKAGAMVHHGANGPGHVSGAVNAQAKPHTVEHAHHHDHHHDHDPHAKPAVGIKYGRHAQRMPGEHAAQLQQMLAQAGARGALITSSTRTPQDQARIMFNNIEKYGVKDQHRLYAGPGDRVINVYERMKAAGASPDAIKAAMAEEVIRQGPTHVSRHCVGKGQTVVDIAPSSLGGPAEQEAFKAAVEQAIKDGRVKAFLHPGNSTDPAYHIEFAPHHPHRG